MRVGVRAERFHADALTASFGGHTQHPTVSLIRTICSRISMTRLTAEIGDVGADFILCGHTHLPMFREIESRNLCESR